MLNVKELAKNLLIGIFKLLRHCSHLDCLRNNITRDLFRFIVRQCFSETCTNAAKSLLIFKQASCLSILLKINILECHSIGETHSDP